MSEAARGPEYPYSESPKVETSGTTIWTSVAMLRPSRAYQGLVWPFSGSPTNENVGAFWGLLAYWGQF